MFRKAHKCIQQFHTIREKNSRLTLIKVLVEKAHLIHFRLKQLPVKVFEYAFFQLKSLVKVTLENFSDVV